MHSPAQFKQKCYLNSQKSPHSLNPINYNYSSQVLAGLSNTGLHLVSHLFLNREGHWGTTVDFTTTFLNFWFSTALWDLENSRHVHSLMLSSHLFLCLPCLLPPFTVPCKMVLARPDEWEKLPYHCSLHLFTIVRSSCGPIACCILAWTSSMIIWSLCEMRSTLQ